MRWLYILAIWGHGVAGRNGDGLLEECYVIIKKGLLQLIVYKSEKVVIFISSIWPMELFQLKN